MDLTAQSNRAAGFGIPRLTKGGSMAGMDRVPFRPWKRALDMTVVLVTSPVWVPVSGALALWIRAVSPGPVFFRQVRVGENGRHFAVWKFRTMRVDADESRHQAHITRLIAAGAPLAKLDGQDDRLIPGARIVRSLGLDEIAQLFNVLRGEMSLVGPRPCTPAEFASSAAVARVRTLVLPGITGLWQVSGKNRTTFRRMLALDRAYRLRCSLWLDVLILARTAPTVWRLAREVVRPLRQQEPHEHPA